MWLFRLLINEVESAKQCLSFEWNGQSVPATNECQEAQFDCPSNLKG